MSGCYEDGCRTGVGGCRELVSFDDEALIDACLGGNEQAWAALIEKYKKLIFSVPVEVGLSREEAADVPQSVCAKLLIESLSNPSTSLHICVADV